MHKVSQYSFYSLGAKLARALAGKGTAAAADLFVPLMEAQAALDALIKGDPITLDHAKADATALLNKLGALFNKHFIDHATRQFRFPAPGDVIEAHELTHLRALLEKFDMSFAAELSRAAVYSVPRCGLFDPTLLAEKADEQFSDAQQDVMGEALRADLRAAGRALAFGLSGAASFHLIRALENVLQRYSTLFTGNSAKFGNLWKDGLGHLSTLVKEKNGPDARIIHILQDIEARVRSTLFTADATSAPQEAFLLFNTASSVLGLMLDALIQKAALENVEATLKDSPGDEDTVSPPAYKAG